MDKGKQDWSWLPAQMPGVARLIRENKAKMGDAHVVGNAFATDGKGNRVNS